MRSVGAVAVVLLLILGLPNVIGTPTREAGAQGLAQTGDVNCDDRRDGADSLMVLEFLAGTRVGVQTCPLGDSSRQLVLTTADHDGDGTVGLRDALTIIQCWSGIASTYCPTVRTDPDGTGPDANDPIEVAVSTSPGTTVEIQKLQTTVEQSGYQMVQRAFDIEMLPSEEGVGPLTITFTVHSSTVAARADLTIFRDGTAVDPCGPNHADARPDPCVLSVASDDAGNYRATVLSTRASVWTVGVLSGSSPPLFGRTELLTIDSANAQYPECTPGLDGAAAITRSAAEKAQVDRAFEILELVDLAGVGATLMDDSFKVYVDYFDCQNIFYEEDEQGIWSRVTSAGYAVTLLLNADGAEYDAAAGRQPGGCYIALFQEPDTTAAFSEQTLLHEFFHCHQAFVSRSQLVADRSQQNWFSEGFAEWFPQHVVATRPSDFTNHQHWREGSETLANDQGFTRLGGLFPSGYAGAGFWDVYEALLVGSDTPVSSEERREAVRKMVQRYELILVGLANLPPFVDLSPEPVPVDRTAVKAYQSAAILAELELVPGAEFALLTGLASTVQVGTVGHPPADYPLFNTVPTWPDGDTSTGSLNWTLDGPDSLDSSTTHFVGLLPGEGVFARLGTPSSGSVTEISVRPPFAASGLKAGLVTAADELDLVDLTATGGLTTWVWHEGDEAACPVGSGDQVEPLPERSEGTPDFLGVANSSGEYREFEFVWRSGSVADWKAANCTDSPPAVSKVANCGGGGQLCSNEVWLKVDNLLTSADRFDIVLRPGGGHCSPVQYQVLVDEVPVGSTGFFVPGEEPFKESIQLALLQRGEHDIAIQATGKREGCNGGTLQSYGVQVTFPAGLVPQYGTVGVRPRTQ